MDANAIVKIINYIENHLPDELDLDKIAEVAGYSKFHLNRMFANIIGCTIHQYVQRRRLTEAASKLVFTDKSIVEIAFIAGYETQQSFTLAFKRLYQESPQVYRKKKEFWPVQLRYNMSLRIQQQKEENISYIKFNIKCGVKAA